MKICKTNIIKSLVYGLLFTLSLPIFAGYTPKYSVAGFYEMEGTGRTVYSMNPAWRIHKGDVQGAERMEFDDKGWSLVSLPNGIELLPTEASGCINYQGITWYRKHFTPEASWNGKRLFLHFEAIMGKSEVWINGKRMKQHVGGFLPVIVDITDVLRPNEENVIAVMTDNSDDPSYPPGKAQDVLDFTYCGGIYRDCWMVVHNPVYITDPNYEDEVAGGGLFVSYHDVSEMKAGIKMKAHVRNQTSQAFRGKMVYELVDADNRLVTKVTHRLEIEGKKAESVENDILVKKPHLWDPDSPYLYQLRVKVINHQGRVVDGYYQKIGIRSIEFHGKDGLWLNGKPYPYPLIGANRHQDFAVIGNALSNSLHWRDAKKLRDAGLRIIRNAHYPQDPAFMDACDELGLFVIVNTPGWQFWNEEPSFAQYVYNDIRQMVRRDRNHPSVFLWEPILNETWYPETFAQKVKQTVEEEYPYPYCNCACDAAARGHEHYSIQFSHPLDGGVPSVRSAKQFEEHVAYFTREWGDNVDDWNSHNSPSRAHRAWGEIPMLVQAKGYARPDYPYTCYDVFYQQTRQMMGGCLWHSFDHQRGYHPDPFYGGIMDVFRQPKYSYYLFKAQRPVLNNPLLKSETGPMVYVANAMTPFSPSDVTVYSNCPKVRLTYCKEGKTFEYVKETNRMGMPSPIITFQDVFHVMEDKQLARDERPQDSYLLAEGIIDNQVVCTHLVRPARRPSKLLLWADTEEMDVIADGSDYVTIIAAVADESGTIKRLNNYAVRFEVQGEGELVADQASFTNPRQVQWGTAPILLRTTTNAGEIRIKASVVWDGTHAPTEAELVLQSKPASHPMVASQSEDAVLKQQLLNQKVIPSRHGQSKIEKDHAALREVEGQQSEFE